MTDRNTQQLSQLRSLARRAPGTPGRVEAFEELVRLDPPQLKRTLRSMALDRDLDRGMRLQALAAIGRDTQTSSLNTLREAAADDDSVVAQRAIERLGKLGTIEDLDRIKAIRTGNRTTQRVLRAAKCFLSYRAGLGQYRHDVPSRSLGASTEAAEALRTGTLTKSLQERVDLVGVDVPGVDVDLEGALRVQCPTKTYIFVPNREHVGSGMGQLTQRQTLLGVLVTENLETGTYDPAFYLMTDPAKQDRFHVFGVRSSGRVALYGTGSIDGETVSFSIRSTQDPVVPPVTIEADYSISSGKATFREAQVDSRLAAAQQRKRKQPKPD